MNHNVPTIVTIKDATREEKQTLKVMTLNMAHGRKDGPNQIFQKNKTIKSNLDTIARVLKRERPDIVALQEADGPSIWSGSFNHVHYLAEKSGFNYSIQGEHVQGIGLSYGTALLSQMPLVNPYAITFAPSLPTFSKGFVLATVTWPADSHNKIDVVSVHLDFSRKSVRQRQVKDIINQLSSRNNPIVIMGDFNCDYEKQDSALCILAKSLNLKAYQAYDSTMKTFPTLKKRLDWILIDPKLEFSTYRTISDILSDHKGVIGELLVN
ncbi:MAG: endonuclease/exonuclease/phosphatase family protein [bacterium]